MKKLFALVTLVVSAFIMISCGSNTPSDVAKSALEALKAKDYEAFAELVYIPEKEGQDVKEQRKALADFLKEKTEKRYEKKQGIKSFEILSEEIDEKGETAVVKVNVVYGDDSNKEEDFKLKKTENGSWMLDMGK